MIADGPAVSAFVLLLNSVFFFFSFWREWGRKPDSLTDDKRRTKERGQRDEKRERDESNWLTLCTLQSHTKKLDSLIHCNYNPPPLLPSVELSSVLDNVSLPNEIKVSRGKICHCVRAAASKQEEENVKDATVYSKKRRNGNRVPDRVCEDEKKNLEYAKRQEVGSKRGQRRDRQRALQGKKGQRWKRLLSQEGERDIMPNW